MPVPFLSKEHIAVVKLWIGSKHEIGILTLLFKTNGQTIFFGRKQQDTRSASFENDFLNLFSIDVPYFSVSDGSLGRFRLSSQYNVLGQIKLYSLQFCRSPVIVVNDSLVQWGKSRTAGISECSNHKKKHEVAKFHGPYFFTNVT